MKSNLKPESQIVAITGSESTIGLDLGDRWSRYCIVDQVGAIAKEDRARSTPEALAGMLREDPGHTNRD